MPDGSVGMSFVSVRDIAAVAAIALTEDGHTGRGYTLTGPRALSWADVADHVQAVTGRAPTTFADYARTAAPAWR